MLKVLERILTWLCPADRVQSKSALLREFMPPRPGYQDKLGQVEHKQRQERNIKNAND